MARTLLGNLLIAAVFGPSASYWCSRTFSVPMSPHLIIPVSAILGIGGMAVLLASGPSVLNVISTAIPAAIKRAIGMSDPSADTKQ